MRLAAGAAEIVFTWCGDRWGHRVTLHGDLVAESVEGPCQPDADPRWPAAPVLTEVLATVAAGRSVVVGVGLAGRSHFSASIAGHPALADTLLFEIACRIQERPGWLGSTYRAAALADGFPAPLVQIAAPVGDGALPRTIEWSYLIGPLGIRSAAGPLRSEA